MSWLLGDGRPWQLVYRQKFKNIKHLKQITKSQELINGAIEQWSKRLLLVVRSHGGHIEHRLNSDLCLLQTISVVSYIENVVVIICLFE